MVLIGFFGIMMTSSKIQNENADPKDAEVWHQKCIGQYRAPLKRHSLRIFHIPALPPISLLHLLHSRGNTTTHCLIEEGLDREQGKEAL